MNNAQLNGLSEDYKIIEAHCHLLYEMPVNKTVEIFNGFLEYFGFERLALLSCPHSTKAESKGETETQNINTIYCKSKLDGKAYAYGHLVYGFDETDTSEKFLNQAKRMIAQGFDGFKMLEGKPELRKKISKRLDDSMYDAYYKFCEDNEIPIIFHLADPPRNWDKSQMDEYSVKMGWFCDESYPTKAEFHEEMEGIMRKFPKLKMTIAHFSFLSDDVKMASHLFDTYENLMFDLTPNAYEFEDFAENPEVWKEFFAKYQDRIIYGSDAYNYEFYTKFAHVTRINQVRRFLETDEEVKCTTKTVKGFKLPKEIIKKIYYDNFYKTVGEPEPICRELVLAEAEELLVNSLDFCENAKENLKTIIEEL